MPLNTIAAAAGILLLIQISFAEAQGLSTYGIKVGAIHSEQTWDYSAPPVIRGSSSDPAWGIDAGIFARASIVPNLGIGAELHYIQRGKSVSAMATMQANNPQGYVDIGVVETTFRCHYLSLPVLAQLRLGSDPVTPYIALGPRVEYLLSFPGSPVYSQFNKWEFGATCALGIELSLGFTPRLLGEISYNTNFTHSFTNENVTVGNQSFSFLLGVCLF
jgi:hypothetical protein